MQKSLSLSVLTLLFLTSAFAQNSHIGGMVNGQFERGGGNDSIFGIEGQGVYNFRVYGQDFAIAENFQATRDTKGYLNRAGWAFRSHSRLRYFIPKANGVYVQAGAYFGHVSYPDQNDVVHDGYTKRVLQPIVGAGYRWHEKTEAVTVGGSYLYQFRSPLYATTTDRPQAYIDGVTRGQRIGVETSVRIGQSKWRGLINFSHGWSTYQRDARYYGDEAAKAKHHFGVTEISLGAAYSFGK